MRIINAFLQWERAETPFLQLFVTDIVYFCILYLFYKLKTINFNLLKLIYFSIKLINFIKIY